MSFRYDWTLLGSANIPRSQLTYVFDLAKVSLNSPVSQGDKLGFSIAGADFAPYCHLETAADGAKVLYQQGQGQYSWRGLQGTTSPVYQRTGRAVKFYATIA